MSHEIALNIDIEKVIQEPPIALKDSWRGRLWLLVVISFVVFLAALATDYPPELLWGAYYVNLTFFMGLACGSVMIAAIFQIVRAKWSPPVRRLAEAHIAFLPWALFLWGLTWFGREYLFYWGRAPMPGREVWMQPAFVYIRFGILLFFLFFM
ncbi:MAG: hypothetical protein KDD42_09490, partial [Bdellovibrionales bacterium]|nr:hypothetical protein [Bdellovibrionales bacterium]